MSDSDPQTIVEAALTELRDRRVLARIWERDASVWTDDPQEQAVCRDRLGWLDVETTMRPRLAELSAFAEEVRGDDVRHVVLCGMGGSSLAPEVFATLLGSAPGFPELIVVDTTDPIRIRAVEERIDVAATVFLIASKSGGTLETDCLRRWCTDLLARSLDDPPGRRLVAITDPGSPLAVRAAEEGYRATFENPADIGGRFSALSLFGLVPAALIGVNVTSILDAAKHEAGRSGPDAEDCPALRLGAAFGGLAREGRDKLTVLSAPSTRSLGAWAEQLIAESTGKAGRGILPVLDEPAPGDGVERRTGDRQYVQMAQQGEPCPSAPAGALVEACLVSYPTELGAIYFRLELATAIASALLGVEPFDQPDVASAKAAAKEVLDQGGRVGKTIATGDGFALEADEATRALLGDAADATAVLRAFLASGPARGHTGLLAYVPGFDGSEPELAALRTALADLSGGATTQSVGPRYLHSSGQLHKGGPSDAAFVVIDGVPAGDRDLPVPGKDLTFDRVFRAQSEGDVRALLSRGRPVLRVRLGDDPAAGFASLTAAARAARA